MREQILEGKLPYPGSALLLKYHNQATDILAFWNAVWVNYLCREDTNSIYWYDRLGHELHNKLIRGLDQAKWITSHSLPGRKWASIELNEDKLLDFITVEELQDIRTKFKYSKYLLDFKEARASKLVRQNGETKRTGLVRTGFRDAGNTQFGYDMEALKKYEDAVKLNLTKSMDKVREQCPKMESHEDGYDKVSVGIFDWHYDNRYEVFTTGDSISDSRGRAISQSLKKVFNPISSKDARASLVIPYD